MRADGSKMKNKQVKMRIDREIEAHSDRLIEISNYIHSNPELGFTEHKSSKILTETLQEAGFYLEKNTAGLETAFKASARGKKDGPAVAFLAEYDALPDIGHACGHNIIAAASLGAAMAVKSIINELGGAIYILGTPAEEGGGGKIIMLEKGAFDDIDISMMIHPFHRTHTFLPSLAVQVIEFIFHGKAAHAAVCPREGINALDAVIQTYNSINALRPRLPDDARIHGIITDGGQAPNIIPARAAIKYAVRTKHQNYLPELLEMVNSCAKGAAAATGTRLEIDNSVIRYDAMKNNTVLEELMRKNLESLSVETAPIENGSVDMGSVDIGNVSRKMPAAHPYLLISDDSAPHTESFKKAAASQRGHEMMLKGARLLAYTAVDILSDTNLYEAVKKEFKLS